MNENVKTFFIPDGQGNGSQIDPNLLLGMMNNGGFNGNNNWIWILFLFLLWGRNGWGNNDNCCCNNSGGNGLGNTINNDYLASTLMQAIQGNKCAIDNLASSLNCSQSQIEQSICGVMNAVQNVGSQVGMSSQQVINAIQSGNQTLAQELCNCCCELKGMITNQGYENRITTMEMSNNVTNQINALNNNMSMQFGALSTLMNDKFCGLEMREMQNKINALQEEKSALQGQISQVAQTSQLTQYINSAVAPLLGGISALQNEINSIKCGLPPTISVPAQQGVYLSPCQATLLGISPYGYRVATDTTPTTPTTPTT